jgi:biopolymer transport protein ExbD
MGGSVGSEDGDMGFQIAPMVDVVFVLLLFFMASAGAQVVEKELSINLPSGSSSSSGVVTTPIVIDISPDGQVTMNNQVFGNPADRDL